MMGELRLTSVAGCDALCEALCAVNILCKKVFEDITAVAPSDVNTKEKMTTKPLNRKVWETPMLELWLFFCVCIFAHHDEVV